MPCPTWKAEENAVDSIASQALRDEIRVLYARVEETKAAYYAAVVAESFAAAARAAVCKLYILAVTLE